MIFIRLKKNYLQNENALRKRQSPRALSARGLFLWLIDGINQRFAGAGRAAGTFLAALLVAALQVKVMYLL